MRSFAQGCEDVVESGRVGSEERPSRLQVSSS
jgi:hypothetical protein